MDFSSLCRYTMVGLCFAATAPVRADVIPFVSIYDNQEFQLVHVTSDSLSGSTDIRAVVDGSSNLVAIRKYSNPGGMTEFTLSQLADSVVLYNTSDHDVIKLQSQGLDPHAGGGVNMIYLANGILGSYDTFEMQLLPVGSQWVLEVNDQAGHHAITTMFLKGNTIFGKVIGISGVDVN